MAIYDVLDPANQRALAASPGVGAAAPQMTTGAVVAATQGAAAGMPGGGGGLTGLTGVDLAQLNDQQRAQLGQILNPQKIGWNLDTLNLAIGGLSTIGNLWMGARALNQSKKQFEYNKGVTETNLMNSIQSYNTALEDRALNRTQALNGTAEDVTSYVDKHKAVRQ